MPVLRGYEKGFCGVDALEMYLDSHIVACPFEPFPLSMDVRYHYRDLLLHLLDYSTFVFVVVGLVVSGSLYIVDVVFAV